MRRRYSFSHDVLFNALGMLAIFILVAAGMFAGMRERFAARLISHAEGRNSLRAS